MRPTSCCASRSTRARSDPPSRLRTRCSGSACPALLRRRAPRHLAHPPHRLHEQRPADGPADARRRSSSRWAGILALGGAMFVVEVAGKRLDAAAAAPARADGGADVPLADIALSTAVKYVAAAYAVVWLLVLLYVWILRAKLPAARGRGRRPRASAGGPQRGRRRAREDHGLVRLVAIGVSHHRTGVGMRGRVALDEPEARCLVQNLRAAGAREAAAISTCNRTEIYLAGPDAAKLAALGTRRARRARRRAARRARPRALPSAPTRPRRCT